MNILFFVLMLMAMVLVVLSLFGGLVVMARGDEVNARYGNRLMRMRVLFQGMALVFFALAVLSAG